jgi:hypothetical protein
MMNMLLAGLTILVLGDSHMAGHDYLISSLHDALESQGAIVHSYGMCGANPDAWLQKTTVSCGRAERHDKGQPVAETGKQEYTWQIADLLAQHHPNLVIVESADAMGGYGSPELPKAWIYQQTHALAARIHAAIAACVWVGPIWGKGDSPYHKTDARVAELSQFLAQSVAPCSYVDSTRFAKPGEWPTTDGQHLTVNGYKAWGSDIAQSIDQIKSSMASR